MSYHRYPRSTLLADYGRALGGLVIIGIPMVAADLSGWAGIVVGSLAALFLVYGLRTGIRHLTSIDVSEHGIRTIGPIGRAIAWDDMNDVRLRYYSTRRDRRGGWMQLKVSSQAGGKIGFDSSLEGFQDVLEYIVEAAAMRRIELNEDTLANLQQMGIGEEKAT